MKLRVLGICGTFMGGLAVLARELGDTVEGSDQNVYPPMSEQLAALGIALRQGYLPEHLSADVERVIVGNALVALGFRGVDAVDWGLALPFTATMVIGSLVGSLVAHRLPPKQSLQAFATMLVVVAVGNGLAAAYAIWG